MEANAQELFAPEALEAIPNIEFDQTANLAAEAGHDQWKPPADANAELVLTHLIFREHRIENYACGIYIAPAIREGKFQLFKTSIPERDRQEGRRRKIFIAIIRASDGAADT